MAKKSSKTEKMTAILDTKIEVPSQVKELISTADGEEGKLHVLFNKNTTQLSMDIVVELASARRVPLLEETIGIGDPLSILLLAQDSRLSSSEVLHRVKQYYRQELAQVNEDALMIALTDNNNFNIPLTPYTEEEEATMGTLTTGSVVPNWRSALKTVILPKTKRNTENPYEARLKQMNDFLRAAEAADPIFTVQFRQHIDNSFAEMVREMAGPTDNAGFPSGAVS